MAVCTCITRAIDVHQEQSMFIRCEFEQGSRSNLPQADVGVGACASGTSPELCDGQLRRSTEHACTTTGRPSPRSPNRAPTSLRPRWQTPAFASAAAARSPSAASRLRRERSRSRHRCPNRAAKRGNQDSLHSEPPRCLHPCALYRHDLDIQHSHAAIPSTNTGPVGRRSSAVSRSELLCPDHRPRGRRWPATGSSCRCRSRHRRASTLLRRAPTKGCSPSAWRRTAAAESHSRPGAAQP
mmetsp:Transcript_107625/g.343507  ORF Transcript_107625/g.343507 Transcript_107625/m.343507 type:complete len:240 (+) Transcript_107625:405-1124(+)